MSRRTLRGLVEVKRIYGSILVRFWQGPIRYETILSNSCAGLPMYIAYQFDYRTVVPNAVAGRPFLLLGVLARRPTL